MMAVIKELFSSPKLLKRLLLKGMLVFFLLLAISEVMLYAIKSHPGFYRMFHHNLASRELLNDYLKTYQQQPVDVAVLGDSVFFGSGLRAHQVAQWPDYTIACQLSEQMAAGHVLDLSLDGLLIADYLAIYRQMREKVKPEWLIVNINYRMLADQVRQAGQEHSRLWLKPDRPKTGFSTVTFLRSCWQLFRFSEAWKQDIFFPSREEALSGLLKKILPEKSWKTDDDRALMLKLRLKSYYYSSVLEPPAALLNDLETLIKLMVEDRQAFVLFFTPQNSAYIDDIVNHAAYEKNRQLLAALTGPYVNGKQFVYLDWAGKYNEEAFFDHCHLKPGYNRQLAAALLEVIRQGGQHE